MRIDFLKLRSLTLSLLMGAVTLALIGCAQTDQRWSSSRSQVEKVSVLKVTPVMMSPGSPMDAAPPNANGQPSSVTSQAAPQTWFDVAFDYHGQSFVSRLPFNPGSWVWVTTRTVPVPSSSNPPANGPSSDTPTSVSPAGSTQLSGNPVVTSADPSAPPLTSAPAEVMAGASKMGPTQANVPASIYVLPPTTELTVYPGVYSSFWMATPAYFYGGFYYPYYYRGYYHGYYGHGVHGWGRGGRGRR
jgi:hypothetical protein